MDSDITRLLDAVREQAMRLDALMRLIAEHQASHLPG